jgi:tRNA (guanine26-N2/guanine27-N2)-dimethyltransferase
MGEETQLGYVAFCHVCGDQQVQTLIDLGRWAPCRCTTGGCSPLAVNGPLWIGPLQNRPTLDAMALEAALSPVTLCKEGASLLTRLQGDRGWPAQCWPYSLVERQIGPGVPPRKRLMARLREEGYVAVSSGVMPGQIRSDAPWSTILELGLAMVRGPLSGQGAAK